MAATMTSSRAAGCSEAELTTGIGSAVAMFNHSSQSARSFLYR
jgi:hypothetical protein